MGNLLHIDTSVRAEGSVSREVTAAFAAAWRAEHPEGGYRYRDLGADPLPHVGADVVDLRASGGDHPLAREVEAEVLVADTVLLGAPMYNFTIPSSLKAWLDWIAAPEFIADAQGGGTLLGDKRVVVVTARGGSYRPGTPRAPMDFQEPYLRAVLGFLGLDRRLEFVHAEMTMAHARAELAQFKGLADESREEAHRAVRTLAVG
ncbi:NAD(P)H-dependent oxidoreductase [Actinosynnema sp. NPDC020468]|uniref:FMN-dependent NADH-azoreductase n=1 Tax=Actinosynnema sp. NPDC020468 TaxID=3154488 RepID=UPI0033D98F04